MGQVQDGESFEHSTIKPLMASILEPHREGPPFTVQRLCELLAEPRRIYKSTKRYLYAIQRALVVTITEEALASRVPLTLESTAIGGAQAGLKRKLPDELANGIVPMALDSTDRPGLQSDSRNTQ